MEDASTLNTADAGDSAPLCGAYRVVGRALVRRAASLDSKVVGRVEIGQVIDVIDAQVSCLSTRAPGSVVQFELDHTCLFSMPFDSTTERKAHDCVIETVLLRASMIQCHDLHLCR